MKLNNAKTRTYLFFTAFLLTSLPLMYLITTQKDYTQQKATQDEIPLTLERQPEPTHTYPSGDINTSVYNLTEDALYTYEALNTMGGLPKTDWSKLDYTLQTLSDEVQQVRVNLELSLEQDNNIHIETLMELDSALHELNTTIEGYQRDLDPSVTHNSLSSALGSILGVQNMVGSSVNQPEDTKGVEPSEGVSLE